MIRRLLKRGICAFLFGAALCARPALADGVLAKTTVLEGNVAYLRIAHTGSQLPDELSSALAQLSATNQIAGIVLDLRFANGTDLAGLPQAEQLLERARLPLAILMNDQTTGAAARLAEDLREANTGLVFGASPDPFQPDIAVAVGTNEEATFLKNPYGVLTDTNDMADADTNFLPYSDIDHTTEADLVREKIKDGDEAPDGSNPGPPTKAKPFIQDPVLARGLDFIKGLVALRLNNH